MSEDQQKQRPSLVEQVRAEMKKSKRESAKKRIRDLMEELEKADAVRSGIVAKIEDVLSEVGDDVDLEEVLK